jgi:hypothetical protein
MRRILVLFWLASAAMAGSFGTSSVPANAAIPSRIDEVLHWLPVDSETIIVANGPFKIEKANESFRFQAAVQSLPLGILQELLPKELVGKDVSLAVEGSRCFRSPHGLGMMPYQGCQVVVFDKGTASVLSTAMQVLLRKSRRTIEISGKRVAVFEEKWENDNWTLYVTQPRPEILLCATHDGYLKEVLDRMEGASSKRAMPEDLPEWRYVDTKSRVWAVRHYSKAEAARDPSSPLREEAAANIPDVGAIGVTFSYNADGNLATVRYLTHAKNAIAIAREAWYMPTEKLEPKIREVETGVVEIALAVDKNDVGRSFLFVLMALLGHAVYV